MLAMTVPPGTTPVPARGGNAPFRRVHPNATHRAGRRSVSLGSDSRLLAHLLRRLQIPTRHPDRSSAPCGLSATLAYPPRTSMSVW